MLAKRIVPCLDIKDGKTVKGINFVNFRDAGDPVELGAQYSREGADELVYLDITASHEGRKTFTELVKKVAANISIPFTVGGGINELKDVDRLLSAGADKVSINSAALRNPELIEEIAKNFGSQVCVVAIDANFETGDWICYLNGGRIPTEKHLFHCFGRSRKNGALPRHIRPRKGGCGIGGKRVSFRGNRHRNFETVSPRRRDQRPSLTATAGNNRFLIGKLSLHADETVVTYLWNCCSMPMKPKTDAER